MVRATRSVRRHTKFTNGVEGLGVSAAEDEGRWLVLGRVGDGVGLASLNTTSGVSVDCDGEGSRDEGSARNNDVEETHVNGSGWIR